MNTESYDLAIIGAGPAGMTAAIQASELGLQCVVIDEQSAPGGQIYRNIENDPLSNQSILGSDYHDGASIAQKFRASGVTYLSSTVVWYIDGNGELGISHKDRARSINAKHVLIATGAIERPSPIPGWTLPGVMTAGAAQILLKSSAAVPSGPLVIAGSGPLLFLVASQLVKAGTTIAAILDTTPKKQLWSAMQYLPKALGASSYLVKGMQMILSLKRAKIPFYKGVSNIRAEGVDSVSSISFKVGEVAHSLACENLLLHQGVVPNVQITRSLALEHHWDNKQRCWRPALDSWGRSTNPVIYVAGDSGGISGAKVAEVQGALSALSIACQQEKISTSKRDALASSLLKQRAKHLRIRDFLDVLYQPAQEMRTPSDDTMVCRCEEVNAGQIRQMVKLGCLGPNQTKSFGRPGMGPCQGRLCGLTVSEIIAAERKVPVEEVGYYRIRPPLKPVTIGELAALDAISE